MNTNFFKQSGIVLLLVLLSVCCKKKDSATNEDTIDIVKTRVHNIDSSYTDNELYVYKNGDTVLNQYLYFKNNKLDTLKSHFYTLSLKENGQGSYEGKIQYFSNFEKFDKRKVARRSVKFYYGQMNAKDSLDMVVVNSEDFRNIDFKFKLYDGKGVEGVIYEIISIDTIIDSKPMNRILEATTLIDNKNPTTNYSHVFKSTRTVPPVKQ